MLKWCTMYYIKYNKPQAFLYLWRINSKLEWNIEPIPPVFKKNEANIFDMTCYIFCDCSECGFFKWAYGIFSGTCLM